MKITIAVLSILLSPRKRIVISKNALNAPVTKPHAITQSASYTYMHGHVY